MAETLALDIGIVHPNPIAVMGGFVQRYSSDIAPKLLIGKVPKNSIKEVCDYFRDSPVIDSLDVDTRSAYKMALDYLRRAVHGSHRLRDMPEAVVAFGLRESLEKVVGHIEHSLRGNEIYEAQRIRKKRIMDAAN